MPTRTVRLALPTFLEKLSKHNEFRKRKTHVYYDEFFANSFPFITAYDQNLSIADKKEWLAAMGWLAHHGKKVDAYVNLSDEAIQLLLNMFQITVELPERAHKVAHLVQLNTEAHPGWKNWSLAPTLRAPTPSLQGAEALAPVHESKKGGRRRAFGGTSAVQSTPVSARQKDQGGEGK